VRARLQSATATAIVLVAGTGCAHARSGAPLAVGPLAGLPRSAASHVMVVVMENEEAGDVLGNRSAPYVNGLARRYSVATSSYAITHPSLPNYLALTSGTTAGVDSDCTSCHFGVKNIVDQLEAAGMSWRAYLEDVPRGCFRGAGARGYAKKHNPFIYYDDVARSPERCARLVGFGALASDLRHGRLPTFVWITPNLCDDGHDCSLASADRFLARTLPPLLGQLGPHGFLVLTWDEGTSDRGCCGAAAGGRVGTIVAGPEVRRGARQSAPVDHYGVLGTIEQALGLAPLAGASDARSGRLSGVFSRAPKIAAAR
jgi:phosphatidylinositol-3-phosphatase